MRRRPRGTAAARDSGVPHTPSPPPTSAQARSRHRSHPRRRRTAPGRRERAERSGRPAPADRQSRLWPRFEPRTRAYLGSSFPGAAVGPDTGVSVIDAANPRALRRTAVLDHPALMAGTWESLKVNRNSGLLVGAAVPFLTGAGLLAVYDVAQDCARPRLLNHVVGTPAAPLAITAHEGGFSPDGKTYWAMGTAPGIISAVSLDDPARPRVLLNNLTALDNHGIGVSPDGNTLYLSHNFGGLSIWDVSSVQKRSANPQMVKLADLGWANGVLTQHSIPVTYGKKNYLFTVLEGGSGGVKFVDVNNPRKPKVVNELKLEVNLPQHQDSALASSMGGSAFAYESHYCAADRPVNPTALACGGSRRVCGSSTSATRSTSRRSPTTTRPPKPGSTSTCGTRRTHSPRSPASR